MPAGAAAALTGRLHHRGVARIMALGSGLLLGVVSIQFTLEAQGVAVARGMAPTLTVLLALLFANLAEALLATAGMIAAL